MQDRDQTFRYIQSDGIKSVVSADDACVLTMSIRECSGEEDAEYGVFLSWSEATSSFTPCRLSVEIQGRPLSATFGHVVRHVLRADATYAQPRTRLSSTVPDWCS